VVVSASSAPPEIIGPSGTVARDSPAAFVAGITALLAADERRRRAEARSRAEQFGWPDSVEAMLATCTAEPGLPSGARGTTRLGTRRTRGDHAAHSATTQPAQQLPGDHESCVVNC
jgi:hypothetical protein